MRIIKTSPSKKLSLFAVVLEFEEPEELPLLKRHNLKDLFPTVFHHFDLPFDNIVNSVDFLAFSVGETVEVQLLNFASLQETELPAAF